MIKNVISRIKKALWGPNKAGKYLFKLECSRPDGKCRCRQWIDPAVDELRCRRIRKETGKK